MKIKELIRLIKSDLYRYNFNQKKKTLLKIILTSPPLLVILIYRIRNYLYYTDCKFAVVTVVKRIFSFVFSIIGNFMHLIAGIELPPATKLGKGLYIPHAGGIVISEEAEIGDYCTISHGVTIGQAGNSEKYGVPKLGSKVFVGVGAVIIGKISVGNKSVIGANAVVTKDVPDFAIVGGIPAKLISYNDSVNLIRGIDE